MASSVRISRELWAESSQACETFTWNGRQEASLAAPCTASFLKLEMPRLAEEDIVLRSSQHQGAFVRMLSYLVLALFIRG